MADKSTAKQLWEQVRANHKKLDSCPKHDFECITPDQRFAKKYRCKNCGGEIDSIAHHWYNKGLEHAENKNDDHQ